MPDTIPRVARRAILRASQPEVLISRNTDLFGTASKRKRRPTVILAQDMLMGSWEEVLAATFQRHLRAHANHQIVVFDLSGLVEGDPHQLAAGMRVGIRAAIRASKTRLRGPRPALRWRPEQSLELPLRTAFTLAWEAMDRDHPTKRLAVPWLTEKGVCVLGHLPPALAARAESLAKYRLLTYRALILKAGTRKAVTVEKECLRFLRRFQELGLVIDRGYAAGSDEVDLGLVDEVRKHGRLKIYESVVAAAAGIEAPLSMGQISG